MPWTAELLVLSFLHCALRSKSAADLASISGFLWRRDQNLGGPWGYPLISRAYSKVSSLKSQPAISHSSEGTHHVNYVINNNNKMWNNKNKNKNKNKGNLHTAQWWFFLYTAATTVLTSPKAFSSALSLQSGPDTGSSFAGGFLLQNNKLSVTGITYGQFGGGGKAGGEVARCILAGVDLSNNNNGEWQTQSTFGSDTVDTVCNGVGHALGGEETNSDSILVMGSTKEGGILTNLRPSGSTKSTSYGLLLEMGNHKALGGALIQGGALMHESKVQYPKAMVTAKDNVIDCVYVVSVHSEALKENDVQGNNMVNWLLQDQYQSQSLLLERFQSMKSVGGGFGDLLGTVDLTLGPDWRKPFGLNSGDTLVVVDMLLVKEQLVVIGYTNGSGQAFGEVDPTSTGDDDFFSGFVTTFDLSGRVVKSERLSHLEKLENIQLYGACQSSTTLYVVGTANANTVYMAEYDTSDGLALTREVSVKEATKPVTDLKCAATNDGALVYIAGTVTGGGSFDVDYQSDAESSKGGNDIFVGQTSSGKTDDPNWWKQMGTTGDDRIASILLEDGGLYVLGDTTGSMYRKNDQGFSDLFIMTLSQNGDYDAFRRPTTPQQPGEKSPYDAVTPGGGSIGTTANNNDKENPSSRPTKNDQQWSSVFGAVLLFGAIASGCYIIREQRREKAQSVDRQKVCLL